MVGRMPPTTETKPKPRPASLHEVIPRVETPEHSQQKKRHSPPAMWVPTTILVDSTSVTSELSAVTRKPVPRQQPPPPPFRDVFVAIKETNEEIDSQISSTLTGTCLSSNNDVHHEAKTKDSMGNATHEDGSWTIPRDYSPLTVGDDEYF
jgi:hypothetical protein